MTDAAARCAAASSGRGETLEGTASRVERWLLVEQPGPWGRTAPVDSRMDSVVARSLASMARRHGVRVLLVRDPEWADAQERRTAFLAHSTRAATWLRAVPFTDPEELLRLDLEVLAAESPPEHGVAGPSGGIFLVCTNGRHDACCADLGRPVVRALKEAAVSDVWEASHVGGDRFAANVVALPSGVYLGRVEPGHAAEAIAQLRQGVIPLEQYRGRSCFPPMVQAAEIFLRRELDERRLEALRVVRGERLGPDELRVCLEVDGAARHDVVVRRERAEAVTLTCSAAGPAEPWRFELVSISR